MMCTLTSRSLIFCDFPGFIQRRYLFDRGSTPRSLRGRSWRRSRCPPDRAVSGYWCTIDTVGRRPAERKHTLLVYHRYRGAQACREEKHVTSVCTIDTVGRRPGERKNTLLVYVPQIPSGAGLGRGKTRVIAYNIESARSYRCYVKQKMRLLQHLWKPIP